MVDFDEQPWDKKPKHAAPSSMRKDSSSKTDPTRGKHARHAENSTRESIIDSAFVVQDDSGGINSPSQPGIALPKKKSLAKRIVLIILAVVIVVLGAGAAYAAWYMTQLDSALSMDEEKERSIQEALTASSLDEPFYMLLLGSDSREGSGTSQRADESGENERSDVMILLRIDAPNRQVTMVSIPRDTAMTMPDGRVGKINEAYNVGGAAYSIEKVSELTGVPIAHYAEIRFSEFEELIDKIGGVTVDVPVEMSYKDALTGETITIQPGEQTLNGQQAQIFVRSRKVYEGNQDAQRQNSTRVLMEAILDKVLSKPITELPGTALDLAECVGTDLKSDQIIALAMAYAGGSGKMTMYSCSGPSEGAIDEESGLWLCYKNSEGWETLMAVVDAGSDPKDIDVEDTAIIPSDYTSDAA